MKFSKIVTIGFFLVLAAFPRISYGHEENQPAYLKINNKLTDHYKIRSFSIKDFILPKDAVDTLFVAGENIEFKVDRNILDIQADLKYPGNIYWDFGDSFRATGFTATHKYKDAGSYFLTIKAKLTKQGEPKIMDSVFINVLPQKDYKLPEIDVFVNNKAVEDGEVISLDFANQIRLSTSPKRADSQLAYYWDLGDGESANTKEINKSYESFHHFMQPILRVSDANGLISDFSFRINNAQYSEQGPTPEKKQPNSPLALILIISVFFCIATVIMFKFIRREK